METHVVIPSWELFRGREGGIDAAWDIVQNMHPLGEAKNEERNHSTLKVRAGLGVRLRYGVWQHLYLMAWDGSPHLKTKCELRREQVDWSAP